MTIRYLRSGTPSFGLWIDDDGVARSWQSSGAAIGRFARDLSADERDAIRRGLADAEGAPRTTPPDDDVVAPGGVATETVLTESLEISYPPADVPEAVGALVETLRELLDDLMSSPVAAIVLDIDGPPYRGRLRHVGDEPITVRIDGLTMSTTSFAADYTVGDTATTHVDATHDGPLEPGWDLALPDAGVNAPDGGFISITVGPAAVDVEGNGVLRSTEFGWVSE